MTMNESQILEVIKRKRVNVALLSFLLTHNPDNALSVYNINMLNEWCDLYLLTPEEFELVRGMFNV